MRLQRHPRTSSEGCIRYDACWSRGPRLRAPSRVQPQAFPPGGQTTKRDSCILKRVEAQAAIFAAIGCGRRPIQERVVFWIFFWVLFMRFSGGSAPRASRSGPKKSMASD